MTLTAIYCGGLLIIIGIAGYLYGLSVGHASLTALIPAAFGLALEVLGFIGRMKETARKHLMHVAVLLALLGFLLPAGRMLSNYSTLSFSAAVMSQLAMALVCLAFVVLSIRSFINARRGEA
jgi:hypothetical protein